MAEAALKAEVKPEKWIGNVRNPETVKYVPRTDFIKSICGRDAPLPLATEDAIIKMMTDRGLKVKVDQYTYQMAQWYISLRNKGARLPKFTRWATGMFAEDKNLAAIMAEAGKYQEKSGDIVISGECIDILRCADTKHFYSCFAKDGGYDHMPVAIAEETPGIAIAYVEDPNDGKLRGRVWLHHARRKDNGKDVVVVQANGYGTLSARQVAELLKKKGFEVLFNDIYGSHKSVAIEYIDCFKQGVHHDVNTWGNNLYAQEVNPYS